MLKKVKIYSNKSAKSLEIVDLLMKKLVEKNFDIVEENEKLAIAVGGDGTFLKMLKKSSKRPITQLYLLLKNAPVSITLKICRNISIKKALLENLCRFLIYLPPVTFSSIKIIES